MASEKAVIKVGNERFSLLTRQVVSRGDGLQSVTRIVAYCPQIGVYFAGGTRREVWHRWFELILNRG